MKNVVTALCLGSSLCLAGTASAEPVETAPEARAYFSLSFGGADRAVEGLHYGLRLDHDHRLADRAHLPALMQIDFRAGGRSQAFVNGVNLRKPTLRLGQFEDDETVDETEEGFFDGIINSVTGFFGGLFGGDDDEEEVAEAESDYEEPADLADGDDGFFLGYSALDWAVLTVGVAGIGFVASEISDVEDTPDSEAPQPSSGGGGGGGGCAPLPICPPGLLGASAGLGVSADTSWLDEGTGQMGDLVPVD